MPRMPQSPSGSLDALKALRRRIALAAGLLLALTGLGTVGYRILEGLSWIDALYMTIITLSTVGFEEVKPLSPTGEVFTIFLIVTGVGTAGYLISRIGQLLIEEEVFSILRFRRKEREVQKMNDHFIICGYGRTGRLVAQRLRSMGARVVVVDQDPDALLVADEDGFPFVHGDATEEEVLERAGIHRARGVAALLETDAQNLYLVLTARGLDPSIKIYAKVVDEKAKKKFLQAGANWVIPLYETSAQRIAMEMFSPSFVEILDVVSSGQEIFLRVDEFRLPENAPIVGQTLASANVRQRAGAMVIGVVRGGQLLFNPDPHMPLQAGDALWVMGSPEHIDRFRKLFVEGE